MSKQESASDKLHRIIPLGLTIGEARAWYTNHVVMPRVRRASVAIVASSIMLFSMLSPLGDVLQRTLITQMVVQYCFFVVAGYLFAYGIDSLILIVSQFSNKASRAYALMRVVNSAANKYGLLTFASAASLMAFWYTPARFDAAVMSLNVLHQMQTTLLAAGGLIFVGSQLLNKRLKLIAPIIVGKAMGLYGTFLLLTPFNVYAAYPVHEQADAGVALLIIMLGLDFTILPIWLYNYFRRGPSAPALIDATRT